MGNLSSTYDTVDFAQPSFPPQSGTLARGTSSQTALYSFTILTNGGFAADGNILQANDTVTGNWTYTYDGFDQLATAVAANVGAGCNYQYDRFGNCWKQLLYFLAY